MHKKILLLAFCVYITDASYCQSHAHIQRYGIQKLNYIDLLNKNNNASIGNKQLEDKTSYRLDSIIEFNYNDANDLWDKKLTKEVFYYDRNNKDTLYGYYFWNTEQSNWDSIYKEKNTYDEKGRINSYTAYQYNYIHGFMPTIREDYAYNNSQLKEMTTFFWQHQQANWKPGTKSQYAYDNNSTLLNDTTYLLDDTGEISRFSTNTQYFYIDGKLDRSIISNWLSDEQQWDNQQKTVFTYYDNSGLPQKRRFYLWNKGNSTWKCREETEYFYDEYQRRTGRHIKEYAVDSGQDEQELRETYTLDEISTSTHIVLPFIYNTYINEYSGHVILSKDLFIKKKEEAERKYRKVKYYYTILNTGGTTGIKQDMLNRVVAFPNPAKDYISFHFLDGQLGGKVSFFSLHGQLMFIRDIQNNVPVNLQSLEKGAYTYKLQSGGHIYSGRIIRY